MDINLVTIPNALELPRVNWKAVRNWIEKNLPEDEHAEAWEELVLQWFERLNESLQGKYIAIRGDEILLFAPKENHLLDGVHRCAEDAVKTLFALLGTTGARNWTGPLVVLFFGDQTEYRNYMASAGGFIPSAGACFQGDLVHVAVHHAFDLSLHATVAHEIAHACLAHLKPPLWLTEGAAQLAEDVALPKDRQYTMDQAVARELRSFWLNEDLQTFWWGEAFDTTRHRFAAAYDLSRVLTRLIAGDYPRQAADFFRHAHIADAGEGAARKYLGKSLSDIAAEFLGPGVAPPTPPDAQRYIQRGDMHEQQGACELASTDYAQAEMFDAKNASDLVWRAYARSKLKRQRDAIQDLETAITKSKRYADAHNNLAWILATSVDDAIRDGARAVRHAKIARHLSKGATWYHVGTLAAAYAEVGDFEAAIRNQKAAIRLAPREEEVRCEKALALYRSGTPLRE